jgi:hypothetical protein
MQCMNPFYIDFDPNEYEIFRQTETFRRFGKYKDALFHSTNE